MKKEHRQLTRRELAQITSGKPVVRRIPAPKGPDNTSRKLTELGANDKGGGGQWLNA